jgi:hypothetical protein
MKTLKSAIPIIIVIGALGLVDTGAAILAFVAVLLVLSTLYIIEHIKRDTMTEQRELIFHDTVPLNDNQLEKARIRAKSQKERILDFFARHPETRFTPPEVEEFTGILLTSARRTITNLTKEGKLIKCQWSEREMGIHGIDNRTWKYNKDYIKPIN